MAIQNYSSTIIAPEEKLGRPQFKDFIAEAINFRDSAEWKGNKRFFISFFPESSSIGVPEQTDVLNFPIRTTVTGSYRITPIDNLTTTPSGSQRSFDLRELSTAEIKGTSGNLLLLKDELKLHYDYQAQRIAVPAAGDGGFHLGTNEDRSVAAFKSGSYVISRMNDDNPSLLIELNKAQQLPTGDAGNKEFVVIPENLHPFIRDNIEFFLIQAGINVSGDASQYLTLDETKRALP
tara:strand:- start:25 stop:729 length:705 start_codon:yes stop_codon:yes gene_type:complete